MIKRQHQKTQQKAYRYKRIRKKERF